MRGAGSLDRVRACTRFFAAEQGGSFATAGEARRCGRRRGVSLLRERLTFPRKGDAASGSGEAANGCAVPAAAKVSKSAGRRRGQFECPLLLHLFPFDQRGPCGDPFGFPRDSRGNRRNAATRRVCSSGVAIYEYLGSDHTSASPAERRAWGTGTAPTTRRSGSGKLCWHYRRASPASHHRRRWQEGHGGFFRGKGE